VELALAAGIVLGIALATTGGGGAVLAVPVLVYALGQSVHAATTESLVIVAAAAAAGASGHARAGAVCWRIALLFAAAAVPGSIAGTALNRATGADTLLGAFAVLLLLVAVLTWRRAAPAGEPLGSCPPVDVRVAAASGLVIGALTGLFGVGGGFAVVPALALGLRVPIRRAVATSLVVVTAASTIGLAGHLATGVAVDWTITLAFAGSAMAAASLGGTIARRLRARTLSRAFAAMLALVATYLLTSIVAFGGPPHG
jgi:uncharacterized membrane protein YfcA